MELRQLKYFVRIVELRSFSKAAKDLYIAQPALSKQIGALESELKTALLTRSVRGVTPTEAGVALYRHAQMLLRQVDRLPAEVLNASYSPGGVVSLGIPASTANILAAPLVHAVQQHLPQVQLRISEGASGQLEELLASGRLEVSLLFERHKRAEKLRVRRLLEEDLFFVASRETVRGGADIPLSEVARHALVLPAASSTTRQLVDNAFAKAGLPMKIVAEAEATSTMKSIASAGLGAAILSRAALAGDDESRLSVRRIIRPALRRGVCLCTSRTAALSRAAQAVVDLIPETAQRLIEDGVWRDVSAVR